MEQGKLKVLIVQPHLSIYGGAETVVLKLAECLRKNGIKAEVMALSLSKELAGAFKDTNFILPKKECAEKVRSIGFWRALGLINEILVLNKLLRKYAREYDVINVHNFPATWAITGINKPVVWMCNEPPDLYCNPRPSFPLRLLRRTGFVVDRLIVNKYIETVCVADNYNAGRAFTRYKRETEIISYGIDYDFFATVSMEGVSQKNELADSFVLLQVGVLSPEKNQMESIRALESLKESIPNLKLILAGKGTNTYVEDLKRYVSQKKLVEDVIFTGHLSKEQVRELYSICNVALFPVISQGGWLSPFEALSAGRPIVVSKTIGAAELIKKEKIGIVTDDFPEAIKDVYLNFSRHKETAAKGKRWVAENLTWEAFANKMFTFFERAVQ